MMSGRKRSIATRVLRSKWPYIALVLIVAWAWGFNRLYRDARAVLAQSEQSWETVVLTRDPPTFQRSEDVRLTTQLLKRHRTAPFRALSRAYYRWYGRGFIRGRLHTQYVRVSDDQLPEIRKMVDDACRDLRIEQVPHLYVGRNHGEPLKVVNWHEPTILVDGELLWAFDREELRYLLAREVAHVKCRHVFLLEMMHVLRKTLAFALPDIISSSFFGTLGVDLVTWRREAEMSADVGGLLVTGDVDVARGALIKLLIGADYERKYGSIDPRAFARQLSELGTSRSTAIGVAVSELKSPDPFLTLRVSNLLDVYEDNPDVFK